MENMQLYSLFTSSCSIVDYSSLTSGGSGICMVLETGISMKDVDRWRKLTHSTKSQTVK